jgi:hypothetical protein
VGAVCADVWFGTGTKLTSKDKVRCFVRCEYILHPNFTLSSKQGLGLTSYRSKVKKQSKIKSKDNKLNWIYLITSPPGAYNLPPSNLLGNTSL